MNCPKEVDLINLDIDSIEYWIWDILEYNPKIMCIEIEPRNYPFDMIFHDRDTTLSKDEKMKKYKSQNIMDQYNAYIEDNFPDNSGLFEKTVFIRRNNLEINNLFDLWWENNLKYSYQDQISYPYVLWKTNIMPDYIIKKNVFNNEDYTYTDGALNVNH